MAWNWSHTGEAHHNVRHNVMEKDETWVMECWAEWKAFYKAKQTDPCDSDAFDLAWYVKACEDFKRDAARLGDELHRQEIIEHMEELQLCDNGGFNAWACPYGCHTVPFDKEKR